MLKKIAYAVITSGLLLVPLGASAMVDDSPFPACNGSDCAAIPHDDAKKDTVATASGSKKQIGSRKTQVAEQTRTSDSPFPFDNSRD